MLSHVVQHAINLIYQIASLTAWLVILTVIFLPLERLFALRPARLRARSLPVDLTYYFLNGLAPALVLAIPASIIATGVQTITPQAYTDAVAELPLWAKVAIGILLSELGAYRGHRFSHKNPFLWRFHKVHHSPESLDWMVNTRAHPVDVIFVRLCGLAPLYLFSLTTPRDGGLLPLIVTLAGTVWAFFVHANLNWRFGPLEWLVATPAFHHWHHTNDEYRDHNYAALLPVIDRLFGTHHLPNHWPAVYGVDEPVAPTFIGQMLDPLGAPASAPRAADPRNAKSL